MEYDDNDIQHLRQELKNKLAKLNDYREDYDSDKFLSDLMKYFDNEVDFNIPKIKGIISRDGKLEQLIRIAEERNTHPVTEFVKELLRGSGKES